MEEQIQELKDTEKELDTAYDDNHAVDSHRDTSSLMTGVVLIGVGGLFLLNNLTGFYIHNWWAFFILIPAVKNLGDAWQNYNKNGRLTASGRGSFIGGLFISTIALIFLLNLNWGFVWPIFLIIFGFGAILNGRRE